MRTGPDGAETALLRLYAVLGWALLPFAYARDRRRLAAFDVSPDRQRERLGGATMPRPAGPLIWLHAASVGESLSILPLLPLLGERATILVTTVTASAAAILARRLPEGAIHQFGPLDASGPVKRFLDHWRPDLCVLVESEIWPQTIRLAHRRAIPVALINARLSARSLARWARAPRTARALLARLSLVRTQTEAVHAGLTSLGADPATTAVGGNMKAAAPAPPDDQDERARLTAILGVAPLWAALSTHPGEEEIILDAHARLRTTSPDARLILAPRHPDRSDAVAALASSAGLDLTRRSRGEPPAAPVYLADTLGETGLWMRMAPVVFLGGSLVPVGGHNPWEPAHTGAAILVGPHRETVADDMAALTEAGAAALVTDATSLADMVRDLLTDSPRLEAMRQAARATAAAQVGAADAITRDLLALL